MHAGSYVNKLKMFFTQLHLTTLSVEDRSYSYTHIIIKQISFSTFLVYVVTHFPVYVGGASRLQSGFKSGLMSPNVTAL